MFDHFLTINTDYHIVQKFILINRYLFYSIVRGSIEKRVYKIHKNIKSFYTHFLHKYDLLQSQNLISGRFESLFFGNSGYSWITFVLVVCGHARQPPSPAFRGRPQPPWKRNKIINFFQPTKLEIYDWL